MASAGPPESERRSQRASEGTRSSGKSVDPGLCLSSDSARGSRGLGRTRQAASQGEDDIGVRDVGRTRRVTAGSVSIEGVLLIPLFLVVVFVIIQAALWAYASSVAQAAAQDAVRTATALDGGVEEGLGVGMRILTIRSAGCEWTVVESEAPDGVRITVEGQALSIVPGLSFHVEESASLPWETT